MKELEEIQRRKEGDWRYQIASIWTDCRDHNSLDKEADKDMSVARCLWNRDEKMKWEQLFIFFLIAET